MRRAPGRESARETERAESDSQRESKQRQKSAGLGTTCTGADRQDRRPWWDEPAPERTFLRLSLLASSHAGGRRAWAGRQAGERVALEDGLCQEESLPGHRGSPGGAMRRMSARSPAGGTSRARASAASAALRRRADRPRLRHALPPAERSP